MTKSDYNEEPLNEDHEDKNIYGNSKKLSDIWGGDVDFGI